LKSLEDIRIVVFESSLRENFRPLSLTRPTFDFLLGSCTKIQRIERSLGAKVTDVVVPKYLEQITREEHPGLRVNDEISEECLAVNALLSSRYDFAGEAANCPYNSSVHDPKTKLPVFARLDALDSRALARLNQGQVPNSKVRQRSSDTQRAALLYFPWQLFEENSFAIASDYEAERAPPDSSLEWGRDFRKKASDRRSDRKFRVSSSNTKNTTADYELLGDKVAISEGAEIERYVTLDSRGGPVIIEDGVQIQSFSHISGPCYIGKDSIVKSAKIREGTAIGAGCRISGEIEESIFFDYSNKNHDGFVGHSVIGSWVNLGALTTNSDLKNTYGKVRVTVGTESLDSGSIKVGVFIGDMVKSAVGTIIYSGKKIGVSSHLFGTVVEDVPSFTIFAKSSGAVSKEIYLESAIETQRRMMSRRNIAMSEERLNLLKALFEMTTSEREAAKVQSGRFELS